MPTRAEIESVRHTRSQLAAWGVPWPPPKGWKSRLLVEAGELKPRARDAIDDASLSPIERLNAERAKIGLLPVRETIDGWIEPASAL